MVKVFELNHKWIFPCNIPAGVELKAVTRRRD